MAAQWFYQTEGQQSGPVDSRELRRLAEAGIVRPETLVRQGDSGRWGRAEQVRGLFQGATPAPSPGASAPPPLPQPSPIPESGSPSRGVSGEGSIRHGLGAAAVNDAPEKPERIWPVTWAAIIVGSGTVLLLLWALVFRGASAPQQEAKVDEPANEQAASPVAKAKVDLEAVANRILGPKREEIEPAPLVKAKSAQQPVGRTLDPVTLYAKSRAAVATILTKDDAGFDAGQGSGFFIARELVGTRYVLHGMTEPSKAGRNPCAYLLTNYHVIRSAATADVQLDDGRQGFVLNVVIEQEDVDLVVVLVSILDSDRSSKPTKPIGVLSIAEGQEPTVGQRVYAIGSPQGLEASLSEGVISGRRELAEGMWRLQTTAPISPGSSGGPLLDSSGHVVGVVTASRRGGQNLNFAVPASQVLTFLKGRCNSRKLWRGSGIEEEAHDAYTSAEVDAAAAEYEGKRDRVGGKLLVAAHRQVKQEDYAGAMKTLEDVAPSSCGEFEYLLHYTVGRAAEGRGYQRILRGRMRDLKEIVEAFRNDEDHQLAKKSYRKSIELNSRFSPAYKHLSDCLFCERRIPEAFVAADALVKLVPRCATAYSMRGCYLRDLNRPQEAYADLRSAAELGPNDPGTYMAMSGVCRTLGENEKEVEAYETVIRLGGKGLELTLCHYSMGKAYQRMGKFGKALECFEEAERLGWRCSKEIAECRKQMK